MNRKMYFFLVAIALAVRLRWNIQGTANDSLLTLALSALWMAFLVPVAWGVKLIEIRVFDFAPWDGPGHWLVTTVAMIFAAAMVWFFPWSRVERWFGSFDAFKEGNRRRPLLVRGAAYILDEVNKRLFGRQKTGGWA